MGIAWTDDLVEIITKAWGDGYSAAQTALMVPGATRNAVIGKWHRLGLNSGKLSDDVIAAKAEHASECNRKRWEKWVEGEGQSRRPAEKPAPRPRVVKVKPPKVVHLRPKATAVGAPDRLMTIMDLEPGSCRWPFGDPRDAGFGYCGREAEKGPYCAGHHAQAYGLRCDEPAPDVVADVPADVDDEMVEVAA